MMKKWPTGAIPCRSDVMDDDTKKASAVTTELLFYDLFDSILIFTKMIFPKFSAFVNFIH